ncbi:TetR family transcriptional regulator [Virgibacillus sp. LDC1]|nr:TetR family transcriptional regulator [Virgibacillus sp. LDC1]
MLDTTLRLFRENGLQATSMSMISNESGVTAFELAERGTVVFVAGRREQEAKTVLFATEGKGNGYPRTI